MVMEEQESKKVILGVFIDLSKAFDCVDHRMFLDKLQSHRFQGIPHLWSVTALKLFNLRMKFKKLSYDVPQGSILSPLLCLMYVNDTGSSLDSWNMPTT